MTSSSRPHHQDANATILSTPDEATAMAPGEVADAVEHEAEHEEGDEEAAGHAAEAAPQFKGSSCSPEAQVHPR